VWKVARRESPFAREQMRYSIVRRDVSADKARMIGKVRNFLLFEAAAFALAALIHSGGIFAGYGHREARIAESIIAIVLLVGLVASLTRPAWTRVAALAAQVFALLATCVGILTIVVGVGPRTVPDIIYHVAIVVVLICGLAVAARTPRTA
jgi:hypothetical protein